LEYLLFVIYLVIFAWLATITGFFRRSGLSKPQLIIVFLLKVMAGIFYGWIGLYYGSLAQMQDTWTFHYGSIAETKLLYSEPYTYLTNLFQDPYNNGMSKFFGTTDSYWNDLKGNIFIKTLSVFNILSGGFYYVNVIFYSFITLFGSVAIYRVMYDVFPGKKLQILVATFLLPSFLYWGSGLHKEGLLFTGLALVIYCVYFGLKEKKLGVKRFLVLLFGLLLILALRNFVIIMLLPALLAWVLASLKPGYSFRIFAGLYILFIIGFFTLRHIDRRLDFPQAVVNRQQDFIKLEGSSTIPIRELHPTAISFLKNTPQAINLSTIRPYPNDVRHILSLAAAIEINFYLLLFLCLLLWRANGLDHQGRALIYFCIFFSVTMLMAIGFSVNNLGAIVRYRSVVIPLLVIPMVAKIDWPRIFSFFGFNIRNKNNVIKST
jgi:hypothetical protein